jgi:hypothetical protein
LPGLLLHAFREYTWISADGSGWRMLLPLRGIAPASWLRKVVQFEEICGPLGGDQMREAAYANTGQKLERGAEISTPGPRGACETLKTFHTY